MDRSSGDGMQILPDGRAYGSFNGGGDGVMEHELNNMWYFIQAFWNNYPVGFCIVAVLVVSYWVESWTKGYRATQAHRNLQRMADAQEKLAAEAKKTVS